MTGPSPLLARRGGCASKKKVRSIRSGADGVVVQDQKHFCLILNHHPVRSIKGTLRDISLDVASTPPGQEGLCRGPPTMSLPPMVTIPNSR